MGDELGSLVAQLSEKINSPYARERAIDLRYTRGKWLVRISFEGEMTTVFGSLSETPLGAVKFCLEKRERWPTSMYDFVYREAGPDSQTSD